MKRGVIIFGLIGFVFACFAGEEGKIKLDSSDGYWSDPKLINMDVDSVDAYLEQQKTEGVQADSIKEARKNRFRRNSIKLDVGGKAAVFGLAYERVLYNGKFEIRGNVGFFPLKLSTKAFIFNLSTYLVTNKYKFNLLIGPGFFCGREDREGRNSRTIEFYKAYGLLLGGQFRIGKNWEAQVMYTPSYFVSGENSYISDTGILSIEEQKSSSGSIVWGWGGVNIGYRF